jgi:hypothetical protein
LVPSAGSQRETISDSLRTEAAAGHVTIPGLQFQRPLGASGWSRIAAREALSADGFVSELPTGSTGSGAPHAAVSAGTLNYRPSFGHNYVYPAEGVRTSDGLHLSPELARLYGIRHVVLDRKQTTLQGVGLASSTVLFAGAMASSFGLLDEKTALWAVGGAALLGAYYGATSGFEQPSWREQWRWPEERQSRDERP